MNMTSGVHTLSCSSTPNYRASAYQFGDRAYYESTPIVPKLVTVDQQCGTDEPVDHNEPMYTCDACCMTEEAVSVKVNEVSCNTDPINIEGTDGPKATNLSKATQCVTKVSVSDKRIQCSTKMKNKGLVTKDLKPTVYTATQGTNTDSTSTLHKTTQVHPHKYASKMTYCQLYDDECEVCGKTMDIDETWHACNKCDPYVWCDTCMKGDKFDHKCSLGFDIYRQTLECVPDLP
jgi:hypothetical protein